MERKKLIVILAILIFVIVAVYFATFYQICEVVTPPKMGQNDPNVKEMYDKQFYCNTIVGRLFS